MNKRILTYNANWININLAGGASETEIVKLEYTGRRFVIKNIIWTVRLFDVVGKQVMPIEMNTGVDLNLKITNPSLSLPVTKELEYDSGTPPDHSQKTISIYRPGQYQFSNVLFYDEAQIRIFITNHIVSAVTIWMDVCIEIEPYD